MRRTLRWQSWRLALCALMAALGAALMAAGGLIPIATYTTPIFSALLLLPVLEEFGTGEGWMVWAVTALLALLLSADREAAALYCTVGYYPMLKPALDALQPASLSLLVKAGFFTAAQAALYALLIWMFGLNGFMEAMGGLSMGLNALLFALLVAVLLLWDRLLGRVRWFYVNRLRPKLPRPGRTGR